MNTLIRDAYAASRGWLYASFALLNLICLFLPWDWITPLNALVFWVCANEVRLWLGEKGWRLVIRSLPEACDECGARAWWSWLKPSFTTFETSPIQTVWAWSFWLGPLHVWRVHDEAGMPMRLALYKKRDPRNHRFTPCANNDGRDKHNWTCEELCIHCGRPASFHE